MFGYVVGWNGQWDFGDQDDALFVNAAADSQVSADRGDALLHSDKSEAARARCGNTAAIIGNDDAERSIICASRRQFYD